MYIFFILFILKLMVKKIFYLFLARIIQKKSSFTSVNEDLRILFLIVLFAISV